MSTISVQVNGSARELDEGASVADLVELMELAPDQVAVELNRERVPRDERSSRMLASGDRIELVTFVGGGCIRTP